MSRIWKSLKQSPQLRCFFQMSLETSWFKNHTINLSVACSEVLTLLPTASSDNLARLWCVETGEIKREYSGHQKAVVCLAFNDSVLG